MTSSREIPELASELVELTQNYIKQETVAAGKRLGRQTGFGFLSGLMMSVGLALVVIAAYGLWTWALPEGQWWVVLARFITVLSAALLTAFVGGVLARD